MMMTKYKARALVLFSLLSATAAVLYLANHFISSNNLFVQRNLPFGETQRLFDIGVVDVNGDDQLDIYTSNHHFRQMLQVSDGKGNYSDVLSSWGLDQSPEFPLAELSYVSPRKEKSGLYLYWYGTNFVIAAHQMGTPTKWEGEMQVFEPVKVVKNEGFALRQHASQSVVTSTRLNFSAPPDGRLVLQPGGQGLPLNFRFTGDIRLEEIFVGRGGVPPQTTEFSLAMRDRHAMAWTDYNNDGLLDVFVNRGALGGMLRAYPDEVKRKIEDELLVSRAGPRFVDVAADVGINKKGCSGRHARWLDYDHDGKIDLFINCYDREHVAGDFPKQLYRQDERGRFVDVASEMGAGLPDRQFGNFTWIDLDNDGDVDLVSFQDDGLYVYRNEQGRLRGETVQAKAPPPENKIGSAQSNVWFFDGKLSAADYNADDFIDVMSSSRRGNWILRNDKGKLTAVNPVAIGLPESSAYACWVDYDNDGLTDLYLFPQGLYRQRGDHRFESTGLIASKNTDRYLAAICNWADLNNDGAQDLLLARHRNPEYKRWWEFSKRRGHPEHWEIVSYTNRHSDNHWLQVRLLGGPGNQEGIGAQVTVVTSAGTQTMEVGSTDGAFFSQGHYRLYFGLGKHAIADVIRIRWSDGQRQELRNVTADRLLLIKKPAQRD
jgi:hypothetical protein